MLRPLGVGFHRPLKISLTRARAREREREIVVHRDESHRHRWAIPRNETTCARVRAYITRETFRGYQNVALRMNES